MPELVFNDRLFHWYFGEEEDNCLHVLSDDKRFIVRYSLEVHHFSPEPFLDVQGLEFPGISFREEGTWIRVRTPKWDDPNILVEDFVRKLITWCLGEKDSLEYKVLPQSYQMHLNGQKSAGVPAFSAPGDEDETDET